MMRPLCWLLLVWLAVRYWRVVPQVWDEVLRPGGDATWPLLGLSAVVVVSALSLFGPLLNLRR